MNLTVLLVAIALTVALLVWAAADVGTRVLHAWRTHFTRDTGFHLRELFLFVDPARHQGVLTFAVMAATIAFLTFLYGLVAVLLTHFLAERMRANPRIGRVLEKVAGVFLIGFGVKLAVSK